MNIDDLETKVIELILTDNTSEPRVLKFQYEHITNKTRDIDARGWVTEYQLDDSTEIPLFERQNFEFGSGILASIKHLNYGLGFVVFVRNWKLDAFEAFTYQEDLPQKIEVVDFSFIQK